MLTRRRYRVVAACAAAVLAGALAGRAGALESDQWTLPPEPLMDIGPAVSAYVWQRVETIIDDTNARLRDERHKASISTTKLGRKYRLEQVEKLSHQDHLAHEIYKVMGIGFPETSIEPQIKDLAAELKENMGWTTIWYTDFDESVMASTGLVRPLNNVAIMPTIRMYGVYLGTEKLGHLTQQGYEYYEKYRKYEKKGRDHQQCLDKAVDYGVDQEAGVYGYIPSGTYSNGDLAANYAGLKLYLNLTRPVTVGGETLPPLLELRDGQWVLTPGADERTGEHYLRRFVTEHFSEAYNPPKYDWTMRKGIRRDIAERAAAWVEFHQTDRQKEVERLATMDTWHGEDYGHSGWEDVLTVVNVHFEPAGSGGR